MTDIHSTPIPTTSLPRGFRIRLRRTAGLAATAGAGPTLIGALTGGGYFWTVWSALLLGGAALAARVLSAPVPAHR